MVRRYIWTGLVVVVALTVMLAVAPADDRLALVGAVAILVLVVTVTIHPTLRLFVTRHRRGFAAAGIGVFFAGLALVLSPILSPSIDDRLGGSLAALLFVLGAMTAIMPLMVSRIEASLAVETETLAIQQRTPKTFRPISDVSAVLAELILQRRALVRSVGPWFLLFVGMPIALTNSAGALSASADGRVSVLVVLLGLGLWIILQVAVLMVAMIKWARFTATKDEVGFSHVPWKALWGWSWRWLLGATVLRSFDAIGPWLNSRLPTASPWQINAVETLIGVVLVVLASSLALVFPAVALDARDRSFAASMRGFRLMARSFYAGVAMIVTPCALGLWVLGFSLTGNPSLLALNVGMAFGLALFFATAVVWIAYLTQVYLKGVAATA